MWQAQHDLWQHESGPLTSLHRHGSREQGGFNNHLRAQWVPEQGDVHVAAEDREALRQPAKARNEAATPRTAELASRPRTPAKTGRGARGRLEVVPLVGNESAKLLATSSGRGLHETQLALREGQGQGQGQLGAGTPAEAPHQPVR